MKMQTCLRLAGEFEREARLTVYSKRRRKLLAAARAAEWYAGYELQKVTGWSDDEIAEAGFPLEPGSAAGGVSCRL